MHDKQIKVRIEAGLHDWLKSEARRNRRSMSAEIAARLDQQRQNHHTTEEQRA